MSSTKSSFTMEINENIIELFHIFILVNTTFYLCTMKKKYNQLQYFQVSDHYNFNVIYE
jgi:hypothetical protein